MKQDKDLTTRIEIESRIATRLLHISNAIDLCTCEENYKKYIRKEIKLISLLVSRGIFPEREEIDKEAYNKVYESL